MQRNEQLQRLASKVAASWTARASALDARDVFAEFVEPRPALAENVDEGLRREVRNGEAAIRDYLTTLCEDPAVVAELERPTRFLLSRSRRRTSRRPTRRGAPRLARRLAERDRRRGRLRRRGGTAWRSSKPGRKSGNVNGT